MDHRKLNRQLRADSAFLQPRRNELAQRLMADGRGRPLTDFPELGFLANHVREVDDDFAGRLRAAHVPARKTCTAYSVDFRRGPDVDYEEGDVYAIVVYAVDNTIVGVEEIDNDL